MGINKRNVINRKDIVLFVMLLLIVMQNFFEQIITWWKFFDEYLVVFVCLSALAVRAYNNNWQISKYNLVIGGLVILYLLLGTISSFMGQYQPFIVSAAGAFLAIKWFLLFLGIQELYLCCPQLCIEIWNKNILYIVIVILTLSENLNFIGVARINNRLAPMQLCASSVFLLGLLFLKWEGRRTDYAAMLFLIETLIFSTKAKGYVGAFLGLVLLYWVVKKHKKVTIFSIIVIGIGCIIIAWNKIYSYYIFGAKYDWARFRLFQTGIKIANDYFPLGTGWSTYGSYYAAQNYSPVYFLYGINMHLELGTNAKKYLMDTYWPIVYAESGWIGFGVVVIMCILLFYKVQKLFQIDKKLYAAGFLAFAYMMITTVEETGFAQPALMCLALLMGIIFAEGDRKEERI